MPDPLDEGIALHARAIEFRDAGRLAESLDACQRSLALLELALGDHPDVANVLIALSSIRAEQAAYADAEAHARRAVAIMEAFDQEGDIARIRIQALARLGMVYCTQARY